MLLYVLMAIYAAIGWAFNARLVVDDGFRDFDHRSDVYVSFARDRFVVGQADLGHVVGLGRSPDVHADSALSLYRLHLSAGSDR